MLVMMARSRARVLLMGLTMSRSVGAYHLARGCPSRYSVTALRAYSSMAQTDFATLGLHPALVSNLRSMGFERPTEPQMQAYPAISSGSDTVLLAETGTGKTLAYLLPIAHQMLEQWQANELAHAAEPSGSTAQTSRRHIRFCDQAFVVLPNRELCAQVSSVLTRLFEGLPHPLRVSSLADETGDVDADVVVSTPSIALRYWRGPERVRWLVLDEADILLAGSFKQAARTSYPVEQLILSLKQDAKLAAPPRERRAGRPPARTSSWKHSEAFKQFVVVGATMPNAGTRNVEVHVRRLFPEAQWVKSERVHREKAELRQFFIKVEPSQRAAALRLALDRFPAGGALVFANSPSAVDDAFAALGGARAGCAIYHKNVPAAERAASLDAFRAGKLRALVCTGLASRGIDLHNVSHVIQYECAPNAVEFMHRIGRTARAGRAGTATTIYTDEGAELVEALQKALSAGHPIEHLFSRKRSFRKHIKRYGSAAPVDWREITEKAEGPLR